MEPDFFLDVNLDDDVKLDIAKSIHIIPLSSKEARRGPGMLNAAVIAGVSTPKRNRPADAVRDITAIEYGGPATDKRRSLKKRLDRYVYPRSMFLHSAAQEAANKLGIEANLKFSKRTLSDGHSVNF